MKTRRLCLWCTMVVVAALLAVGCQPEGPSHPPTYGVTGTVTLDGNPVEGATVTFVPGQTGDPAVGTTDASGKYSLKSFGSEDGATPGEYQVTVTKFDFAEAGGGSGGNDAEMPDDYGGAAAGGEGADDSGKNALPAKYAIAAESGLSATVTEDASQNVFDLALESGGAAPAKEAAPAEE